MYCREWSRRCRVKAPGVVTEPMVFTEDAPEPKVLVRDAPVPIVEAPLEVRAAAVSVPPDTVNPPVALATVMSAVPLNETADVASGLKCSCSTSISCDRSLIASVGTREFEPARVEEQVNAPAVVMVQPVEAEPPAKSMEPVEVLPMLMAPAPLPSMLSATSTSPPVAFSDGPVPVRRSRW